MFVWAWSQRNLVERIREMLEVGRGEFSRKIGMPLHRRLSLKRNPEPRGTDNSAGADHAESRPFVLPQRRRTDCERADDQRIGHEQRVMARPDGFPLRVDQVDIGLEDRDLVGRTGWVFTGHGGRSVSRRRKSRQCERGWRPASAVMRIEKRAIWSFH